MGKYILEINEVEAWPANKLLMWAKTRPDLFPNPDVKTEDVLRVAIRCGLDYLRECQIGDEIAREEF